MKQFRQTMFSELTSVLSANGAVPSTRDRDRSTPESGDVPASEDLFFGGRFKVVCVQASTGVVGVVGVVGVGGQASTLLPMSTTIPLSENKQRFLE